MPDDLHYTQPISPAMHLSEEADPFWGGKRRRRHGRRRQGRGDEHLSDQEVGELEAEVSGANESLEQSGSPYVLELTQDNAGNNRVLLRRRDGSHGQTQRLRVIDPDDLELWIRRLHEQEGLIVDETV